MTTFELSKPLNLLGFTRSEGKPPMWSKGQRGDTLVIELVDTKPLGPANNYAILFCKSYPLGKTFGTVKELTTYLTQ